MANHNRSHGDGRFNLSEFKYIGTGVIFESGVKVFHPENISIGDNVYVGHNTILKGYYKNEMKIGSNTWIGQNCFFHSAGNLFIAENVGIGPNVQILTSAHNISNGIKGPILLESVEFSEVLIGEGADIGVSSVILPGVTIGKYSQIGAMSLVNKSIGERKVAYGNPCLEKRNIQWLK